VATRFTTSLSIRMEKRGGGRKKKVPLLVSALSGATKKKRKKGKRNRFSVDRQGKEKGGGRLSRRPLPLYVHAMEMGEKEKGSLRSSSLLSEKEGKKKPPLHHLRRLRKGRKGGKKKGDLTPYNSSQLRRGGEKNLTCAFGLDDKKEKKKKGLRATMFIFLAGKRGEKKEKSKSPPPSSPFPAKREPEKEGEDEISFLPSMSYLWEEGKGREPGPFLSCHVGGG